MHAHVPVLTAFASSLPPQAARLSFTSCCWVHMDVVVACALCQSNPFRTLGPERLSALWLTFPEALAWGIIEQTEGQLLRDRGLEVARQLPVRKHRVLGMNQQLQWLCPQRFSPWLGHCFFPDFPQRDLSSLWSGGMGSCPPRPSSTREDGGWGGPQKGSFALAVRIHEGR